MTGVRRAPAPAGSLTLPEDDAVRFAFTDRHFGNVSHVVGNGAPGSARGRLLELVGLGVGDGVFMEQVHGAGVARVGRSHRGRGLTAHTDALRGVDALITSDAGVGLVVLVADCVPLVLAAPGRGVAVVHAGRRGVTGGVVAAAVDALAAATGAAPAEFVAFRGPAIGGCCYELPAEIADEVSSCVPAAAARTTWGAPSVDLPAGVEAQLRAGGVGRVERVGSCTACDAERWFSHRATTAGRAPAGRQAAVVARLPRAGPPPSYTEGSR